MTQNIGYFLFGNSMKLFWKEIISILIWRFLLVIRFEFSQNEIIFSLLIFAYFWHTFADLKRVIKSVYRAQKMYVHFINFFQKNISKKNIYFSKKKGKCFFFKKTNCLFSGGKKLGMFQKKIFFYKKSSAC